MQILNGFLEKNINKDMAIVDQNSETSTTRIPLLIGHALDSDVKCLYDILNQYRLCKTKEPPSHETEIQASIRLNGYRALNAEDASAEFGVLFLDHPHGGNGYWQEANIQICHTKSSKVRSVYVYTNIIVGMAQLFLTCTTVTLLASKHN